MNPSTPPDLSHRFTLLIAELRRAVAARMPACPASIPLLTLLWGYLHRAQARFASLVARAGTPPPQRRHVAATRPRPPRDNRLPGGFAWVVRLVPQAAASGSQLQHLLSDPDLAALLAASPQMRRLLRPLCRMLGAQPAPGPERPAAPRPPRSKPPKPARPRRARQSDLPRPGLGSFRLARIFAPL